MGKVDRTYRHINWKIESLIAEATEFGRRLDKKENREVIVWRGWVAAHDTLCAEKAAEIAASRQAAVDAATGIKKLSAMFMQVVNPAPDADSAEIKTAVRAEIIAHFNKKTMPPAIGMEKSAADYAHACKGNKIRMVKFRKDHRI